MGNLEIAHEHMDIEKTYTELTKTLKLSTVLKNESMAKHTSFKIGGNADILVKAKSIEDIKVILEYCKSKDIPLYVMGNGSNLLVKDNGIRGIVITVEINDINIEENKDKVKVTVGAGVKLGKLAGELLKRNIGGFEFASRNTRNYWRSSKNECRCSWQRNERHSS